MPRDYEVDGPGFRRLLAGREMQDMCMEVARDYVPRVVAATPRDEGDTAASTGVEEDRGPDGRAGAKIVQSGAAVQQHFGNARTRATHYLDRVFGNG